MADPVAYTVVRHRCVFCRYSRTRRATVADHIERCWHNPQTRTCRTCASFVPAGAGRDCVPGRPCSCDDTDAFCEEGVTLPADGLPVIACPRWNSKETDRA
ncbi:hypothetical protein [Nocardia abscessus]|uniref:hypothetical protein n=1 Tax=Nocardia abscessus TaxID=120957 RepID=UPI002456943F|nr:hypothetical protein [Nocardia abscessus]